LKDEGVRSLLGVPIQTDTGLIGVLHVGTLTPRHFTADDQALLQLIADRVGLAIDHGRLLDAERRARADAELANRAKDEFLATLSHELRTPLTAILGWTRMLRDGALDQAKTQRAIEVIERNARAQTQLINDLLDVSRIISGRLRLEVTHVDVASIVEAVADSVRPGAEAKDIVVTTDVAPSLPRISADAGRIQQVLWNVASNAVKFTPRQGRVEIAAAMRGAQIEIAVTDTGPGIPADVLPFVFDRFRQADSTTTRSHGGLGLGLAIARHLVELHGGTIDAKPVVSGRGTIVTVRLPVHALSPTTGLVSPASGERLRPDHDPDLAGVRVLVVDDEPDARELLTVAFQRAGLVVMAVSSAAQALAAFEQFRPDVLVSDIAMPEQDGYELIERVRALGARGRIPAIALTAHARTEDRRRAIAKGYQTHMAKPVDPAELIRTVARLVAAAH
jgi:signal transduction histidine kinase